MATFTVSLDGEPKRILTDRVIASGMLEKKAEWKNEWRHRFFVLTVRHIYWAEEEGSSLTKQLEIRDATVEVKTIPNKPFVLQFKSSGRKQKTMILAASSNEEFENWLNKISMLAQGRTPPEDPQPVTSSSAHTSARSESSASTANDDIPSSEMPRTPTNRSNKIAMLAGISETQVTAAVSQASEKKEKMRGWLKKQALNKSGLYKSRYLVLTDTELMWFDDEELGSKPKGSLELSPDMVVEVVVSSLPSSLSGLAGNDYQFRLSNKSTSLSLQAADYADMDRWMVAINAAVAIVKTSIAGRIEKELKSLNLDGMDLGISESSGSDREGSGRDSLGSKGRRGRGLMPGMLTKSKRRTTFDADVDDDGDDRGSGGSGAVDTSVNTSLLTVPSSSSSSFAGSEQAAAGLLTEASTSKIVTEPEPRQSETTERISSNSQHDSSSSSQVPEIPVQSKPAQSKSLFKSKPIALTKPVSQPAVVAEVKPVSQPVVEAAEAKPVVEDWARPVVVPEVKPAVVEVRPNSAVAKPVAEVRPNSAVAKPVAEARPNSAVPKLAPQSQPKTATDIRPSSSSSVQAKPAAKAQPAQDVRPQTAPVKQAAKPTAVETASLLGKNGNRLKPIKSARGDIYYIECDDDDDKDSVGEKEKDRTYLCGVCKCM